MIPDLLGPYRQVWLADFEFCQPPGEVPDPICLVAREWRTGETLRIWQDEFPPVPPFPVGEDCLFVSYYASAELSCFLSLQWPLPVRILDLFCEFRCLTNGRPTVCGNGLLGALAHYGLGGIEAAEKTSMRDLAIRGGPFTQVERSALLDYCQSDVEALGKLLPAMLPQIDLPRALLRGRYMAAVAGMERTGVPIDTQSLEDLRDHFEGIKTELIRRVDQDYGVYVPTRHKVDAKTKLGTAILSKAAETGTDPSLLSRTVDYVWQDSHSSSDFQRAIKAARKVTGLTVAAIGRWEDSGRDHSTWPRLDVQARSLAGEFPELGIGRGYSQDDGYDDTDYSARLWELLRQPDALPKRKFDPEILNRAAELLEGVDDTERYSLGPLSFCAERFASYLIQSGIPWPRLPTGGLALDQETFRQMARSYVAVAPLRELRHTLGELRLFDLAVGSDGRNRTLLSPFRATSGRNAPSNTRFIFGPSVWLRGLIRPRPGRAASYVDWSQQEFGIAAALSGDETMKQAYASGDPYLSFAIQAGLAPPGATKKTHPVERDRCKVCILAVNYGMGPEALAQSLGQSESHARELLALHRATYPAFWRWSQSAVDHAMLKGWLQTVFGWKVQVGPNANPRSLGNFPAQANGAEMLRLACCLATERGIQVCAPVHDALLVEGPDDQIETIVEATQAAMREASRIVLDGFELRADAKIIRHPDRYLDDRGVKMWDTVQELIRETTAKRELELVGNEF